MPLTQDNFIAAVARLNELTRSHVIRWTQARSLPPPRGGGLGLSATLHPKLSFEAAHEGRILRVTQYEASSALGFGSSQKYVLDVRDPNGNASFEFPDIEGVIDLFHSVQTQRLDIEGFIKKLVEG